MLLGCRMLLSQLCPLSHCLFALCSMNSFTCVCSLSVFGFLLTEDLLALGCVQSHINGEGEGMLRALCSSALSRMCRVERWGVECWGRHQRQALTSQTDANPEPNVPFSWSCHAWLLPGVLVSQNWLFSDSFLPGTTSAHWYDLLE